MEEGFGLASKSRGKARNKSLTKKGTPVGPGEEGKILCKIHRIDQRKASNGRADLVGGVNDEKGRSTRHHRARQL